MRKLQQCVHPSLVMLISAALLLSSGIARSQSELEKALRQYSDKTVKGYIQPVADLFGANVNAGYYHSAAIPQTGFHLALDIVAMGSMVGDDQKTYLADAPPGFSPAQFKTATVFGGQGTLIKDANDTSLQYRGSDGLISTSIFPLAVPQLSIGYIFGTEATIRFITTPSISNGKFPKTTLWGIGVRHSVSQYLPSVPVDISAGVYYNKFTVGDLIDFHSVAFGAQASKKFAVLVVYGGLQYEKSTMKLNYNSSDPLSPPVVDISLDGANTFRGTVGVALALGFFNIFADANFGTVTNFSGGIGFGM